EFASRLRGALSRYYPQGAYQIGDGCSGLAGRILEENTSARPLQLFDDLNPIDMLVKAPEAGFIKNHVTQAPSLPVEESNGTGVFLLVYQKIHSKKGSYFKNSLKIAFFGY
ncbi:hypothetical protein Tco_1445283, partial [Tanacetum coccineum]